MIKNILYGILFILIVVIVLISIFFCGAAAIGMPVILSIAYHSWWWMLSYLCYGVVLYVAYRILKEVKYED
jgi:hypothetical protein